MKHLHLKNPHTRVSTAGPDVAVRPPALRDQREAESIVGNWCSRAELAGQAIRFSLTNADFARMSPKRCWTEWQKMLRKMGDFTLFDQVEWPPRKAFPRSAMWIGLWPKGYYPELGNHRSVYPVVGLMANFKICQVDGPNFKFALTQHAMGRALLRSDAQSLPSLMASLARLVAHLGVLKVESTVPPRDFCLVTDDFYAPVAVVTQRGARLMVVKSFIPAAAWSKTTRDYIQKVMDAPRPAGEAAIVVDWALRREEL